MRVEESSLVVYLTLMGKAHYDRIGKLGILALILLLGTLLACRHRDPYPVVLPSGGHALALECDNLARCVEAMGEACEHGYVVIGGDTERVSEVNAFATKDLASLSAREDDQSTKIFYCKEH